MTDLRRLPVHNLDPESGTDGQVPILSGGKFVIGDVVAGTTLDWFNVKDPAYGAVGNGTTDDRAAINLAIAALNAAGGGILYFPVGTYKVTGALTTFSVAATVIGEGCADSHFRSARSTINCTSATANMFTVGTSAHGTRFSDLNLVNTASTTPTAGSAIQVLGGDGANYERLSIKGFYINMDMPDGQEWTMERCFIYSPVKYGVKLQHVDLPDGGDMGIINCEFLAGDYDADAAVRWETGGGLRFIGNKINARTLTHRFTYGIWAPITSSTADFVCIGNSIENFVTSAVKASNNLIGCMIIGNETGTWNSSTAPAFDIDNFDDCVVMGNTCTAGAGSTAVAVKLTNVDRGTVIGNTYNGYTGEYSLTSCTSIQTLTFDTTAEAERIRDIMGVALVQGTGITITVDDAGDTITIAATNTSTGLVPVTALDDSGNLIFVTFEDGSLVMAED